MKIINLTPHPVTLFEDNLAGNNYNELCVFHPSEEPARCAMISDTIPPDSHEFFFPIQVTRYGQVEGLPEEQEGIYYIVSALVRLACPDRRDLLSPANMVRVEEDGPDKGKVLGCRAFDVNP